MTSDAPGGTGLGLAISQRIVEAMGSTNSGREHSGQGVDDSGSRPVFDVDPSETHPVPLDSSMGGLDGESTLAGTALVVEDNDVNQNDRSRSPPVARNASL